MAVLPTLNKRVGLAENRIMGRICCLCISIYFLFILDGRCSEVRGFTYFLSGRDGAGHTLFDRFELYPNGKASWQVASKGGTCPSEGGIFLGHLNEQEKKKLLELIHVLYESEKEKKDIADKTEDSTRRARHLFQVEYDNAVFSFELSKAFANSQAFFQELAFIKAKLQPQRAIRMTATKEKITEEKGSKKQGQAAGLIVSFLNISTESVRLFFPKNPGEVFFLNKGEKISYRKPPLKRDILLHKGKNFSLTLDTATSGKMPGPIYYDSGVMVHHALLNLKKDLPPVMEVFLCAGESL
ncbi:MAG: hypothetical protein HYV97_04330 [Bdellovibrio sp.]|nr:hypothetical protein [Bdellovibrio sp.]